MQVSNPLFRRQNMESGGWRVLGGGGACWSTRFRLPIYTLKGRLGPGVQAHLCVNLAAAPIRVARGTCARDGQGT